MRNLAMLFLGLSLSLTGCAPSANDEDAEGGKGESSLAEAPAPLQLGKADGSYLAQRAAEFADDHWNDGIGLCAEFTSRSLRAGAFPIARYTWVPDIYAVLSEFPYDEYIHKSPTDVGGDVGDVVIYSNDIGDDFCDRANLAKRNCGHVGIITVAGDDLNTARADFHNSAHYHMQIGDILEGTRLGRSSPVYSSYRVYHLSRR